jgi:hypothetical protein
MDQFKHCIVQTRTVKELESTKIPRRRRILKLMRRTFFVFQIPHLGISFWSPWKWVTDVSNDERSQRTTHLCTKCNRLEKTVALLLFVLLEGQWVKSQRAYVRIATSNNTTTKCHFVEVVLFWLFFQLIHQEVENWKGRLWEIMKKLRLKKYSKLIKLGTVPIYYKLDRLCVMWRIWAKIQDQIHP